MRDALVTHGVNVRPQKVRHGSREPRGIAVSAHYEHWQAPVHESRRAARERIVGRIESRSTAAKLDRARAEMYAAQDLVKLLKSQGKPYRAEADLARRARHAWLQLNGGVESRQVEVSTGAESNPVKAQD